MKLKIQKVDDPEQRFSFNSEKHGALKEVAEHFAQAEAEIEGPWTLDLKLVQTRPEYYLFGNIHCKMRLQCARCVEGFDKRVDTSFEQAFEEAPKAGIAQAESEGQADIIYFDGREIELGSILEEQLQLSLPLQALCKPDCRGICPQCGQNLNSGTCSCKEDKEPSPFSALDQLKIK